MRADRLIALLLLLQNRGRTTVANVAGRLEVSSRTVLRDIDALSSLGVPVYAERGRSGGIGLLEGYATQLRGLSPLEAEAMALVSTPSIVAGLDLEKPLATALEKISAAVPAVHQLRARHARDRLLFDTTLWFGHAERLPILEALRAAVWDDAVCRLKYERLDGVAKSYRVDAYALVAKIDVWYLVAATKDGMRVFRAQRIREVERVGATFVRDPRFELRSFWQAWCLRFEANPGHRYEVELVLTAKGRDLLLERYGGWHARALAEFDGAPRARVTLDLERESIALATLFELGSEAEVIRPRRLKTLIAGRARALLAAHADA